MSNPVRELTPSRRGKNDRKTKVNLTEESLLGLRNHLRASEDAGKYDLVDLVDVLSGLGCRIGELLALDWIRALRWRPDDARCRPIEAHG